MRDSLCLFILSCGLASFVAPDAMSAAQKQANSDLSIATLEQTEDRVIVSFKDSGVNSKFTEYRFGTSLQPTKPVLFPVLTVQGKHISRQFPIDDSNATEQRDHPHHKSIWFAHGDVNGIDFWSERASIRNRSVEVHAGQITSLNDWMNGEVKVCEDKTHIQFGQAKHKDTRYRWIDHRTTLIASESDLVLGDTKEGTFAIRTAPFLRLFSADKKPVGSARNSQAVTGKDIWGKEASWVCYSGQLDGKPVSVAILDHPNNLRHPTTWHAREYGLIAANPFGLHHFQAAKKGTGDYRIVKDDKFTLRYEVVVIEGEASDELLRNEFMKFSNRE